MKQGKSLVDLAKQLQDVKENSKDYIVPTEKMSITLDEVVEETEKRKAEPVLSFGNGTPLKFKLNDWSHRQMAQYSDIPQTYYDRIRGENPQLYADAVNHGIAMQIKSAPEGKREQRMVRTYRDEVRAMLSNKYRRLDCYDLLETVFPALIENKLTPISSELTDRRMYIQAVTERITADIKKGDTVQYGIVISSSDVGCGSVRIEPMVFRLVCTNGLITSNAIRKFHIGRTQDGDDVSELLTDQTKDLTDAAFWAQVRDVVMGSMKPEVFEAQVDRLRIAANQEIKNFDIPRVIELASKSVGITSDTVKKSMVAYLANGADGAGLTKWGLANAFTHAASLKSINYDDSVDLERAGARIIDLTDKQWDTISATSN